MEKMVMIPGVMVQVAEVLVVPFYLMFKMFYLL